MSLLKWALIFFLISIVAAVFGFTGIAVATADVARILFYIFLVIFVPVGLRRACGLALVAGLANLPPTGPGRGRY